MEKRTRGQGDERANRQEDKRGHRDGRGGFTGRVQPRVASRVWFVIDPFSERQGGGVVQTLASARHAQAAKDPRRPRVRISLEEDDDVRSFLDRDEAASVHVDTVRKVVRQLGRTRAIDVPGGSEPPLDERDLFHVPKTLWWQRSDDDAGEKADDAFDVRLQKCVRETREAGANDEKHEHVAALQPFKGVPNQIVVQPMHADRRAITRLIGWRWRRKRCRR